MLRSFTTRSVSGSGLRAIVSKPAPASAVQFNFVTRYHSLSSKRPRALVATQHSPFRGALLRFKTTNDGPSVDKIDTKGEAKLAKAKLVPDPAAVSGSSSVRQVFEESQAPKDDVDMLAGIKADIVTIKDTFGLQDVPKKSLYLGAAGLIPYAATSLSTVYLAFDINHAKDQGSGYLFSPETAHQLLAIIEPIQIGYGAVIISFLGAIHWGLEYAAYGGEQGYKRFAIGVLAPAVAWPTMLMPVEYALISQFLAFNFLYFADARATVRGWCPPWYSTYRFVLTFIVGASIVISLVGRGQVAGAGGHSLGALDKIRSLKESQMAELDREEKNMRKAMAEAEEAEEDEDEDGEEGKDEKDGEKKDDEDSKDESDENEDKDGEMGDKKDEKKEKKEKK